MPHGIPTHAWTKIGSDLFFFKQRKYLLAVDYYSNWPVLIEVPNTGTPAIIEAFEQIFADYGIPKELITDAGTNYTSKPFQDFCKSVGVEHRITSSYHHQSNGKAERMIQTVKCMLNTTMSQCKSPWMALLTLRTTPLGQSLPSPAELMGKKLRTLLPDLSLDLQNVNDEVCELLTLQAQWMKHSYDKHNKVKPLPNLSPRTVVMVQKAPQVNIWTRGHIVCNLGPQHNFRSYKVRLDSTGCEIIRNHHLLWPFQAKHGPPKATATNPPLTPSTNQPNPPYPGSNYKQPATSTPYATRSGRSVKMPHHFAD